MYQKPFGLLRQEKILIFLVMVVFILPGGFASSVAAEEKPAESGWELIVAPYLWAISMDGNVTVRGLEAEVDASFNDILDELNFAFMLAYEARKGRWGLWGNTIYADLGDSDVDGPAGLAKVDLTVTAFWQELGGFYRLGTWDLADRSDKKTLSITVDTFLGARYTYLDTKIDFKFDGPFRSFKNDVDEDKSWLEPIVGVRTIWDFCERWALSLAGNIGGAAFGSDFAWSASGLIGYQFNLFGENNARLFGGYRALSQDYTDGSGDDKFEWDVTLHGPILGLDIRFQFDPWLLNFSIASDSKFQYGSEVSPLLLPLNSAWRFGAGAQHQVCQTFFWRISAEYLYGGTLDTGLKIVQSVVLGGRGSLEGQYDDTESIILGLYANWTF